MLGAAWRVFGLEIVEGEPLEGDDLDDIGGEVADDRSCQLAPGDEAFAHHDLVRRPACEDGLRPVV